MHGSSESGATPSSMVPIAAPANSRDLSALSEIVRQVAVAQHLHLVLFIAEAFLQARPERQVGARVGVLEGFVEADGAALDQFVEVLVEGLQAQLGAATHGGFDFLELVPGDKDRKSVV